ncbi:MAG: efflux RND transporter periplasmic adaptor subunit [bacterium]
MYFNKKTVNQGDFVKANENIYTFIINPEIWIIAELPVSYLKDIYIGKNVLVKTYDNQTFNSIIDYIFPNSDFENKTIKIRIKSLNKIRLPWNIPLEVIITETKTALFIPIDSIINKGDKKIVFKKVDKNTFKPIYINIGQYYVYEGEGYYEVIEGLKEEDEIAYSGVFLLDSEARVKGLY